ncbi:hypothetical protein ZWY2020_058186 [Hordeum vulgare]|nr:hypothetical protein ZWY2020_058186 [Hordeum vulgare]
MSSSTHALLPSWPSRLVLPSLDCERGSYGLKEAALAAALVEALGIAKDSNDVVRLTNWHRGGGRRNVGNFSLVATEEREANKKMVVYLIDASTKMFTPANATKVKHKQLICT